MVRLLLNVLDAIGTWSDGPGPLYRRLANAVHRSVERGDLPPGTVLPPERQLARQLAVGRSTVVAAYDLLRSQQVLESRQGSGTWVSGASRGTRGASGDREALPGAAPTVTGAVVDLATASSPAAPEVRAVLGSLDMADVDAMLGEPGYTPMGLPALRIAVAGMFTSEGLNTSPEQVLVTTGDQQALFLLVGHLLSPGDLALVEDPTSPGMLDLLRAGLVAVRAVPPVATSGIASLRDALRTTRPQLTYLMPAPDPSGAVASAETVLGVAAALRTDGAATVEDAGGRHLVFADPPPYLSATAQGVITVGSVSKLFWGGLRVGWIRAPESLIGRLGRDKARTDLGTPALSQYVAARLLTRLADVRARRLDELLDRMRFAGSVLGDRLPDFTWTAPAGGLTLWLRLPRGTSAPFVETARRHGVAVVPGSSLSVDGLSDDRIRITYDRPRDVFAEGIARLEAAWNSYDRDRSGPEAHVAAPWVF